MKLVKGLAVGVLGYVALVIAFESFVGSMGRRDAEREREPGEILVNAEKAIDTKWDRYSFLPPFSAMVSSYSSIAIQRYNVETVALLQESFKGWARDIQVNRCPPGQVSTEPGACGDIKFYQAEVKFDDLENEEERNFFMSLPTSFRLKPEEVDKLREVARRLLAQSEEFQRLIRDLEIEEGALGR